MAASLEEDRADVGTVNLGVAERACLIFLRLVVEARNARSSTETGRRVALHAELIHVRVAQKVWIRGTVGRVAGRAALGLDRLVLVNERSLLVHMAIEADRVSGDSGAELLVLAERIERESGGAAVRIVAVGALHHALDHLVMERHVEERLNGAMAAEAKLRLLLHEQEIHVGRMVRGMAIGAAHVVLEVDRIEEVHVFVPALMARHAALGDCLIRHLGEVIRHGRLPARSDVQRTRTVTAFATLLRRPRFLLEQRFVVRRVFKIVFENIRVTGLTGVRPDIFRGRLQRRGGGFLLLFLILGMFYRAGGELSGCDQPYEN